MSNNLTAFVDETGTNVLDTSKPGVSNLFICVAVVVDADSLAITEAAMRQLSEEMCGGAEIKSNQIGGNLKRRLAFLESIQDLPFGYIGLIINKDRISKDSGLQFKRSFYKYINGMLYERLRRSGDQMRIVADTIGGQDFMDSFMPYLAKRGFPSLFQPCFPEFASSAETPLIQLADLIAGSLAYCFDPDKAGEHSHQFRELLRKRESGIQCWPPEIISDLALAGQASPHDARLQKTMQNRVAQFLLDYENDSEPERQMQVMTLKELMFARQFEDRDDPERQAIVADELIARLAKAGFEEIGKQAFQSNVIGKIRDEGIILAGTTDGYRLALTAEDIRDYLNHDRTVMEPMINRMLKARDSVKTDTAGQFDILDQPQYLKLKAIADIYHDVKIESAAARQS